MFASRVANRHERGSINVERRLGLDRTLGFVGRARTTRTGLSGSSHNIDCSAFLVRGCPPLCQATCKQLPSREKRCGSGPVVGTGGRECGHTMARNRIVTENILLTSQT